MAHTTHSEYCGQKLDCRQATGVERQCEFIPFTITSETRNPSGNFLIEQSRNTKKLFNNNECSWGWVH